MAQKPNNGYIWGTRGPNKIAPVDTSDYFKEVVLDNTERVTAVYNPYRGGIDPYKDKGLTTTIDSSNYITTDINIANDEAGQYITYGNGGIAQASKGGIPVAGSFKEGSLGEQIDHDYRFSKSSPLEYLQQRLKETERQLKALKDQIRSLPVEEKSDRRKLITKKE